MKTAIEEEKLPSGIDALVADVKGLSRKRPSQPSNAPSGIDALSSDVKGFASGLFPGPSGTPPGGMFNRQPAPVQPPLTTTAGQMPYQQGTVGGMLNRMRQNDSQIKGVLDTAGNQITASQPQPAPVVEKKQLPSGFGLENKPTPTAISPVAQSPASPALTVRAGDIPWERKSKFGDGSDIKGIKDMSGNVIMRPGAAGAGQGFDAPEQIAARQVNPFATNPPTRGGMPGAPNQYQQRQGDPSSPDLKDEFSNAMIENRNPAGKVTKIVGPDGRVSYSGGNVSGEVSFQGADGNALPGRQKGGLSVIGNASDAARMSALADKMQNERLNQEAANAMNQPMSRHKRAQMVELQKARMANETSTNNAAATNRIAESQFGLNRQKQESDMATEKIKQDLWSRYINGTPEEKAQAAEQLNMLNGKVAQRAKYSSGRIGTEADGITPIYGTYNTETGLPPSGVQAQASPKAAPNAGAIAMLKSNPKLAADFDAKYGAGASKQILGQ